MFREIKTFQGANGSLEIKLKCLLSSSVLKRDGEGALMAEIPSFFISLQISATSVKVDRRSAFVPKPDVDVGVVSFVPLKTPLLHDPTKIHNYSEMCVRWNVQCNGM
ncbi:hypothetical protein TSAR_006660 [Trichomalopsis sarcophagae]|uniref:Uncharacterized protein n=1 Tax=Trichomalopsis sarcophagae TaxID=543379 RepID=A0A232EX82_9HYME|nr:hypothetical protein TSAR_006660 [Trichomalopsis sarcophagae]